MSPIHTILVVLATVAFASVGTAAPQESPAMEINLIGIPPGSTPSLLPGEPVEARLVVRVGEGAAMRPDLILHIGSIAVPDSMLLMRPMRNKEGLPGSGKMEFILPLFFMGQPSTGGGNEPAYLMRKPGQYAIWVEDRATGGSSAKIMVTVRGFPSDDVKKSFEAYEKLKGVAPLLCFEKNVGTTGEDMDQFLDTYGNSPYAPFVWLARGIQRITALKGLPVGSKDEYDKRQRDLAGTQSYFEKALAANPNVFVQERALYFLALTKAWAKDYETAHKILTGLVSSYPSGAKSEDAGKLLKELEDHRTEWGKP
jgi:hypothetical protein